MVQTGKAVPARGRVITKSDACGTASASERWGIAVDELNVDGAVRVLPPPRVQEGVGARVRIGDLFWRSVVGYRADDGHPLADVACPLEGGLDGLIRRRVDVDRHDDRAVEAHIAERHGDDGGAFRPCGENRTDASGGESFQPVRAVVPQDQQVHVLRHLQQQRDRELWPDERVHP